MTTVDLAVKLRIIRVVVYCAAMRSWRRSLWARSWTSWTWMRKRTIKTHTTWQRPMSRLNRQQQRQRMSRKRRRFLVRINLKSTFSRFIGEMFSTSSLKWSPNIAVFSSVIGFCCVTSNCQKAVQTRSGECWVVTIPDLGVFGADYTSGVWINVRSWIEYWA